MPVIDELAAAVTPLELMRIGEENGGRFIERHSLDGEFWNQVQADAPGDQLVAMMLAPSSVNPVPALVWDDDCTPEQKFGAMRQGLMTYLGEADAGSVNWIRDRELRYVTFSTPHE